MKTCSQFSLIFEIFLLSILSVACKKEEYREAPTITTGDITEITSNSALIAGSVISDGGSVILQKGICWSTQTLPDTTDNWTNTGGGSGPFSSTIEGLEIYTTYYVRAYAVNAQGINYGNEKSFHSAALPDQIDGIPLDKYIVKFSDDFNNNLSGWYEVSDQYAEVIVNNGYYNITSLNDGFLWFWHPLNTLSPSYDFEIETNLSILPQNISQNEAGSFIWDASENGFKGVMLFQSNSMWFGTYTNVYPGIWTDWNFYTSLSALNPLGNFNKLTIRKFENVYYFFVNNQFIFSHVYIYSAEMIFGFMIQAHGKMLIDNIKISIIGSAVKTQINKAAIMQSFRVSSFKGIPYALKGQK